MNSVWDFGAIVNSMPSGGVTVIVWEKPRENSRSLPLSDHAVTGTRDFEFLLVALGHADDHVGDQGARQSVERTRGALVVRTLDDNLTVFDLGGDRLGNTWERVPLGPFTDTF